MNYLIITDLDDPIIDGQTYLHSTCMDLQNQFRCYWLNFFQKTPESTDTHFTNTGKLFTEIQSSEKNYEEQIRATIRNVRPDLIHSIGPINIVAKKVAEELGIPCLIGYEERENFPKLSTDNPNTTHEYLISDLRINANKHSNENAKTQERQFINLALALSQKSPNRNIGIFCIWGDQGLGNLAHTYTKLLRELGYKVHIFSFQSYLARNRSLKAQSSPGDWAEPQNADSVYYSYNIREDVGWNEFLQFVRCNKLRTIIFPEVCCPENWSRLYKLRELGYNVITVPLIEIVRDIEVLMHKDFDLTLCCTQHTYDTLKSYGIGNLHYIGHGFKGSHNQEYANQKLEDLNSRKKIKYLHVAGHNPVQRKNTKRVIQAFIEASRLRPDIELTITSLVPSNLFVESELPDCISIIDTPLPREDIENLYKTHDVSIQVSSHEGLGLGFFESLQKNTPVITLNGSPHNEFIQHNENGVLIDCWEIKISDNIHAIINAWDFNVGDLTREISALTKDTITNFEGNIQRKYNETLSEEALLKNLHSALDIYNTPREFSFVEVVNPQPIHSTLDELSSATYSSITKAFVRPLVSPILPITKKILALIWG